MTLLEVAHALKTAAAYAEAGQPFIAKRWVDVARRGLDEATTEPRRSIPAPVARLRLVRAGPEHISKPLGRALEQLRPKQEGE